MKPARMSGLFLLVLVQVNNAARRAIPICPGRRLLPHPNLSKFECLYANWYNRRVVCRERPLR